MFRCSTWSSALTWWPWFVRSPASLKVKKERKEGISKHFLFSHPHAHTLWFPSAQGTIKQSVSEQVGSQQHSSFRVFLHIWRLFLEHRHRLLAHLSGLWSLSSCPVSGQSLWTFRRAKFIAICSWQCDQPTVVTHNHDQDMTGEIMALFCSLESRRDYWEKPSYSVVVLSRKVCCNSFQIEKIFVKPNGGHAVPSWTVWSWVYWCRTLVMSKTFLLLFFYFLEYTLI